MKLKHYRYLCSALVMAFSVTSVQALVRTKSGTGTDLAIGAAWDAVPTATDIATWSTGSLGGALTLSTAQSWLGIDIQAATAALTITGSQLTLGTSGVTIAAAAQDLTISGNTIVIGGNQSWNVGTGRILNIGSSTGTINLTNNLTTNGAGTFILGGAGTTTLTGSGIIEINGATFNNNMQAGSSSAGRTGTTTLTSGSLVISTSISMFGSGALNLNGGTIGSGTGTARTINNTVNIGGNVTVGNTTGGITTAMNFTGPIDLGGATRTFDVYANSVVTNFGSGCIFSGAVGNGGINLTSTSGTGIMTLMGANTYSGTTTVSSGYLAISNTAISTSSSLSLAANTRLFVGINGTTTVNNLSGASSAGIRTDFTISGTSAARTLEVNQTADGTYAGSFTQGSSRTISLLKKGSAALTLSGTGGYTGGTTLSQGTLITANSSALGSSGTITINDSNTGSNNTTLNIDATSTSVTITRAITIANQGSGTVTLGSTTSSGSNAAIFSGAITLAKDVTMNGGSAGDRFSATGGIGGTGNVTIAGTNRVMFGTTANTFNGNLTVNSGATLQLSDSTSTTSSLIPDTSAVIVNGTLNISKGANSETIGSLSGNGTIQGHPSVTSIASSLIINQSGNSTFSGILGNGGANGSTLSITKSGSGTLILTGSNSYTGTTSINSGTLQLGNGGSTGTLASSTTIVNNSNLTINRNNTVNQGTDFSAAAITGTGSFTASGTGTITLNAANSYSGGTIIHADADLRINGSQTGLGTVDVAINAKLGGSGSVIGAINVSGILAPGNSIESLGSGALNFATGSTYAYELQTNLYATTPGVAGDLAYSSSTLSIANGTILTLSDLATSTKLPNGSKLTLISSSSGWNGGLFSYDAGSGLVTLNDDSSIILGANEWVFNYNDISGGPNYASDQTNATNFVTMTVVPEPTISILGSIGLLTFVRRRR